MIDLIGDLPEWLVLASRVLTAVTIMTYGTLIFTLGDRGFHLPYRAIVVGLSWITSSWIFYTLVFGDPAKGLSALLIGLTFASINAGVVEFGATKQKLNRRYDD